MLLCALGALLAWNASYLLAFRSDYYQPVMTIGRLSAIHDHGAGDILEVVGGKDVLLLPFTRAVVPTVDLSARRIVADPPADDE